MSTGEQRIKKLAEEVLDELEGEKLILTGSRIFSVHEREKSAVVDLKIEVSGKPIIPIDGISTGPDDEEWRRTTKKKIRERILKGDE